MSANSTVEVAAGAAHPPPHGQPVRPRPAAAGAGAHGTRSAYDHGCRCAGCRGAHNAYQRGRYARTKHARLWATLDPAKCGTRTQYLYGCRCQPCTTANRDYMRRYRNRDNPERFQQPWRDRRLRPPKANAALAPGTRCYGTRSMATDGHSTWSRAICDEGGVFEHHQLRRPHRQVEHRAFGCPAACRLARQRGAGQRAGARRGRGQADHARRRRARWSSGERLALGHRWSRSCSRSASSPSSFRVSDDTRLDARERRLLEQLLGIDGAA